MITAVDDPKAGVAALEEALALFRQSGDRWAMSHSLRQLFYVRIRLGNEPTLALVEETLTLARAADDKYGLQQSLQILGSVAALRRNDLQRAETWLEESLSLARTLHDYFG